MRTIEINLYQFNELSPEAQQKAIDNLQTINVDHFWGGTETNPPTLLVPISCKRRDSFVGSGTLCSVYSERMKDLNKSVYDILVCVRERDTMALGFKVSVGIT